MAAVRALAEVLTRLAEHDQQIPGSGSTSGLPSTPPRGRIVFNMRVCSAAGRSRGGCGGAPTHHTLESSRDSLSLRLLRGVRRARRSCKGVWRSGAGRRQVISSGEEGLSLLFEPRMSKRYSTSRPCALRQRSLAVVAQCLIQSSIHRHPHCHPHCNPHICSLTFSECA